MTPTVKMSLSISLLPRRIHRMHHLLKNLKYKPKDRVFFEGKELSFPASSSLPVPTSLPPSTLQALGYFFSARGVAFTSPHRCQYILLLGATDLGLPASFFQHFGGYLFVRFGSGATLPRYRWQAHGERARDVARVLSPYARRKEGVLEEFVGLYPCSFGRGRQEATADTLREFQLEKAEMKENFFPRGEVRCWGSLAELMDVHGHVRRSTFGGKLRLCLSHPSSTLVHSARGFIGKEVGKDFGELSVVRSITYFDRKSEGFQWSSQNQNLCRLILRRLLENGLRIQRERVASALEGTEGLPGGNNQGRYLKAGGLEGQLSSLLTCARQEIGRLKSGHWRGWAAEKRVESLSHQVGVLEAIRERRRERRKVETLRRDSRDLIRYGEFRGS